MKPIIEDKTTKQINLGCSRNDRGPVITEIDLELTKVSLKSANVQKLLKIFFKALTAIVCPIKAVDRFT